ncbi:MAG: hypothetical protein ACI81O_002192 [Cyclobacteriaceae bacterium]|jgi:hypothetical protein
MSLNKKHLLSVFGFLGLLLLHSATSFASVGKVLYSYGKVSAETPATVVIKRGDRIEAGHVIVTGPKAYLQLLLDDGTKIDLRPGSRFVVESLEMPVEAASAANPAGRPAIGAGKVLRANFSLQKGGFRTMTGLISKRDPKAYRVATPSAVIGVRGTNYSARLCAADCGADVDDGLFIGISEGAGSITNNGGELELGKNEYGFAADFNTPPAKLVKPPESLNDPGLGGLEEIEEEEEAEDEDNVAANDGDEAAGDDDAEGDDEATGELGAEAEEVAESEEAVEADEVVEAEEVAVDDAVVSNTDGDSAETSTEGTSSTTDGGGTGESGTTEATASTDGENSLDSLNSEFGSTSTVETTTTTAPSAPTAVATATVVALPSKTVAVEPAPQVVVVSSPVGTVADITSGTLKATPRGLAFALSPSAVGINSVNETMTFNTNGNLTGFTDNRTAISKGYKLGTAKNLNAGVDTANSLKWGRWSQGSATSKAGDAAATQIDLTNRSLHWLVGPVNAPAQVITGTANYILAGNTDPTNNLGQVGILGTASLGADFTNSTVTSNVQIGIADKVWKATGNGAINANLFNGLYSTVTVGGVAGGSGTFGGVFTNVLNGAPQGAGLTYQLVNGSSNVSGVAIFKKQ